MSWLFNGPTLIFLLGGLGVTVKLALCAIAIAFVLGILLALARISKSPWMRWPATIYIEGMRALPMLLVIVYVYFAVPRTLGIKFSPFTAGVIAMSCFSASLVAEIVRAGILAVPRGIVEAAESQGLRGSTIMQKIVLPIALRNMMPALVAQFVSLLKDTSLTAIITIPELLGRAQIVYAAPPFKPLPVFALVAAMYFVVNYSIGKVGQRLETRA
jgi:putative glutamine transport system permease protein